MSERRAILLKPLIVWGVLLLLAAISLTYALLPGMPLKPAFALGIVLVQATLVLGALMNLGRASTLVRMTAAAGIVWLGFLFLMTFADLWTR
jgi:caa(3)-type oxidase subunit IV